MENRTFSSIVASPNASDSKTLVNAITAQANANIETAQQLQKIADTMQTSVEEARKSSEAAAKAAHRSMITAIVSIAINATITLLSVAVTLITHFCQKPF